MNARAFRSMLGAALRLALSACLLALGLLWRWPLWVELRPFLVVGVPAASALLLALQLGRPRSRRGWRAWSAGRASTLLAAAALALSLAGELRFQWIKRQVLHAEPARLARLGRHVVIGYRGAADLGPLLERRAIAGVFVTSRNARDRSAEDLAREVAGFQEARVRSGGPPLWIAADQEGGPVSRLSPPLPQLPGLAALAGRCQAASTDCEQAVAAHAARQAEGLGRLGVTLDLAPVVDLDRPPIPGDRYTRIHERAISADPAVVARVADAYCAALARAGVACALKHFPGLGRAPADTHRAAATVEASAAELARTDWLPFDVARGHPERFIMLSHVRLAAVDPDRPASISALVVRDLRARGALGPLLTDDLSMMALFRSREGLGEGAVQALAAGVDLLLVSYDPDQYYVVMDALLRADRAGRLDPGVLDPSDLRLERARQALVR